MWPQVQAKVCRVFSSLLLFWDILFIPVIYCSYQLYSNNSFFLIFRCHGPKPPPNPEYTLKPKKKKSFHQTECTPGSPCPSCPELVWRSCVGQHFAADRMVGFCLQTISTNTLLYHLGLIFSLKFHCLFFVPCFRWSVQINHYFHVITCVGILYLVVTTFALELATRSRISLCHQGSKQEVSLVKCAIFLAKRC